MASPPPRLNREGVRKGPWSAEEDELLRRTVDEMSARNWSSIADRIPGRTERSCRLRWCCQLSQDINHSPFTADEDAVIISAHAQYGNKWALIAQKLPSRTGNAVKNYWNSTLRRRGFTVSSSSDYEVTVADLVLPSFPAPPQQPPLQPQFLPSLPAPPSQAPPRPQVLPSTTAPPPQTPSQPQFAPPMGTGFLEQSIRELFNLQLTRESARGLIFSALIEEIKDRIEDEMKQNGIEGINYEQNEIEAMASRVMCLLGINDAHP